MSSIHRASCNAPDVKGWTVTRLLLAAFALLMAVCPPAFAVIKIDITGGAVQPVPVAVPAFPATSDTATPAGSTSQLGNEISKVIAADLNRSGLFRPINPAAFTTRVTPADVPNPQFAAWRTVAAQALVTGYVQPNPDGSMLVACYVYDVFGEEEMGRTGFTIRNARDWRRTAHKCADFVYEKVTGEKGYFDSRIVYVSETGPKNKRIKRLAIMDQDGANHRFLTSGQSMVLTPRFSPSQQQIAYMSFFQSRPRVFLLDVQTGRQELIGDFPNMTFAPRFSPDGNSVVLSLSRSGNTDIYLMDLRTRRLRQLTTGPAIDTAPSFSPDGSKIVFESDRGGSQQLYVMNADGSGVQRISFDPRNPRSRYATPVWSPRGDLIAFTKMDEGKFRIGVMRPDGSGERVLTDAWQDEGPTWSPNGRVIIFFRMSRYGPGGSGGGSKLWSVDLTGQNERPVPTPLDGSDPAWSPLLP